MGEDVYISAIIAIALPFVGLKIKSETWTSIDVFFLFVKQECGVAWCLCDYTCYQSHSTLLDTMSFSDSRFLQANKSQSWQNLVGKIKSVSSGVIPVPLFLVTFPVPFDHATTCSVVLLSRINGTRAHMLILFLSHQWHVHKMLLREYLTTPQSYSTVLDIEAEGCRGKAELATLLTIQSLNWPLPPMVFAGRGGGQ